MTTVNHLSYSSPDYRATRDFYIDLFGMRDVWDDGTKCQLDCGPEDAPNTFYMTQSKPGVAPTVAHFAFGLPDYWKRSRALGDELLRRKLPGVHPDGEAGWFVNGPSGYVQHIVTVNDAAMFPGAAAPCEVASSATCKDAYAVGVKAIAFLPKPNGKGFKALYFEFGLVIENHDEKRVKAELERRGIASKPNPAGGGLMLRDPNGLDIGIGGAAYG